MRRLTLRFIVAVLTFTFGVIATSVWLIHHLSSSERLNEPSYNQPSTFYIDPLREVPTVAFCDLLSDPIGYNNKVVRTHTILVSNAHIRELYSPLCITTDVSVGFTVDPSFELSEAIPQGLNNLVRFAGEPQEGRASVVVVGRFESSIFNRDPTSKYQHGFIIMRLEKAEAVNPDMFQPLRQ